MDLARKAARVQCRPHDLRQTFSTQLAENGVPESTMLTLMGHMSRATLESYRRDAVAGVTSRSRSIRNSDGYPPKISLPLDPPQVQ
ncbi:MAG: site-specific integrase [Acidobacteriaceae bacterium]|nr:site-specific integrase [Acidobacteriaceae bacterium]MBV9499695.1 site-specific integrase [Acidobacteriaceae bacterium]